LPEVRRRRAMLRRERLHHGSVCNDVSGPHLRRHRQERDRNRRRLRRVGLSEVRGREDVRGKCRLRERLLRSRRDLRVSPLQ
jgi:hypothetical protein